jgi:hypothetical protein
MSFWGHERMPRTFNELRLAQPCSRDHVENSCQQFGDVASLSCVKRTFEAEGGTCLDPDT